MLLRSTILLFVGVAATPQRVDASEFGLLSAVRVAEVAVRSPGHAKGDRRPRRSPLLVPPDDLRCADSFRGDDLRIWSSTTGSIWHLLPPKLLGAGATMNVVEAQ